MTKHTRPIPIADGVFPSKLVLRLGVLKFDKHVVVLPNGEPTCRAGDVLGGNLRFFARRVGNPHHSTSTNVRSCPSMALEVLVDHLFQPLALMKYACHLQSLGQNEDLLGESQTMTIFV